MENNLDKDNLTKRLNRYFKVTGHMGGLLARLGANKYLGFHIDKEKHAFNLKKGLGEVKGPFMKIAQLLSIIPDAIPQEYANQLIQMRKKIFVISLIIGIYSVASFLQIHGIK